MTIDFILEKATYDELFLIATTDDNLDIRYEASRQLQGKRKREKFKHKKYWNSFKTFKEG